MAMTPPTPLDGARALRKLIMGEPSIRNAGLALVGGDVGKLWLVAACASMMMCSPEPADGTRSMKESMLADTLLFTLGGSINAAGYDTDGFLNSVREYVQTIRDRVQAMRQQANN